MSCLISLPLQNVPPSFRFESSILLHSRLGVKYGTGWHFFKSRLGAKYGKGWIKRRNHEKIKVQKQDIPLFRKRKGLGCAVNFCVCATFYLVPG